MYLAKIQIEDFNRYYDFSSTASVVQVHGRFSELYPEF